MPFDRSLLTPIAGGFDRSLLTPIEPSDEEAQKEQEEILSRPAVPAYITERGERPDYSGPQLVKSSVTPWQRFRSSELGHKIFGSTELEKEAFPDLKPGGVGLMELPEKALQFTTAPPPIANPIRKQIDTVLARTDLPPTFKGLVKGGTDLVLNLPLAPIPVFPKTVLTAFAGDYVFHLPEARQAYHDALKRGDYETATRIAVNEVGGGALLAYGAGHSAYKPEIKGELKVIPMPEEAKAGETLAPTVKETKSIEGEPVLEIKTPQEIKQPKETEPTIESYGQRYVREHGVEGAQKRIRHLQNRAQEEINRGSTANTVENLIDEWENIAKALQPNEVPLIESTESTPPPATPAEPATEPQTPKWTSATAETPLGGQLPMLIPNPVAVAKSVAQLAKQAAPAVKAAGKAVIETGKELAEHTLDIRKVDDQRKAVLNWSAKLQRSFGEAESAQREIQSKVPDRTKREGITNWIQADGDAAVLQQRLNATSDPKLKAGYEAALNLTPEEIGVANDVRNAYGSLGTRGQTYNVLKSFKDNYVTQIWDLRKGPVMAGGRTLRDKFRFSRASTFDTFFDGEQAGFKPKTKDISQLLPVYLHEMNSVIAARQLVSELGKGTASDGRPLVAPRGVAVPVSGSSGQATLVMPKAVKGDTLDYKQIPNQPAFNDWIWAGKDTAGNPVFEKADLALHPEAYKQLKNVLGKSAIKEWYSTSTTPTAAIPKAIVKGLDIAQSETKRTMLGLFAPFHQVQEATHAIGHRVNPTFNVPKIDLVGNADQMEAAQHGLMLAPDRASANQFMEGFKVSGIVSRIPIIGKAADFYSHYLFHEYIPGLKYKTYEAILARNNEVYAKDLASNKVTPADVKALSAEQANAAYGHLNYADLARNPTIQHILQLGLLAPDFLEARGRFFGQSLKGLAGTKVGREQIIALATLALAQAVTAWTGAQLTDGKWDADRPFEFRKGNRRYTMRSVPEDVSSLLHDSRVFVHSRLSPIIGKGALQYASGYDWRGQKVTPLETTKELAKAPVPLTARGFLGIGNSPLSEWEQLASAAGIKISRYSSSEQIFQLRQKWMENNPDPKIRTLYEQEQKMTLPESIYRPLLLALENEDTAKAKEEYLKLRKERGKSVQDIADYFHQRSERIVTPSERKFRASLTPEQQNDYRQYEADRKQIWRRFQNLKSKLATTP